ncbi:hypothetical protein [Haloarcula pelagica]|uniref:hypothetical protein n=1 Tax=Haloarcula pelagica TaxID=3033389 RepID=UPI0024C3D169|nr:hypothetical protein [Halomicroarcula sp. YJ-61-S]
MTTHDIDDRPIDSITDPDTLLDSGDVSVTEDTAVVDEETVEFVADAPDMAPVGVTTGGETLVMRVTEDCSWKLPSSNVAPEASFAESAREWVRTNTGLDISIESVAGCWRHRLSSRETDRTATRHFVVLAASPSVDGQAPAVPVDDGPDRAAEAGWFERLPDDGARVPGTGLFLD